MTTDKNQENTLLMEKERVICRKVAGTNEAPHNQRAQALLALNEGLSQAQAGERAGLTLGQVKYCLSKFRQQRLDFFPEHLQGRPAPAETSVGPEAKPVPA